MPGLLSQLSLVPLLFSFQNIITLVSLIVPFLMGLCILFSPCYHLCGIWQAAEVNKHIQSAVYNSVSLTRVIDYLE